MKKFLFLCALAGLGIYLLSDWVKSGKMDEFLRQRKDSSFTPTILYALAEGCYLFQKHEHARRYFEWLVQDYPQHKKIDKLRWELAQCYEKTNQNQQALEQYTILRSSYPTTHYGRLGTARYERMRF